MTRRILAIVALSLSFFTLVASDVIREGVYHHQAASDVVDKMDIEDANSAIVSSPEDWQGLSFVLHRNGEPDPCRTGLSATKTKIPTAGLANKMDKYGVESFLTETFAESLEKTSCGSTDNQTAPEGLLGFCDMGSDRTPILLDHKKLVRVSSGSLPCRWLTREGIRITSLHQLHDIAHQTKMAAQTCSSNPQEGDCKEDGSTDVEVELHLYGVPAGRVFMFAPKFVGEIFELNHLTMNPDPEKPVSLKVLSLNPRVFDILNIFAETEADAIVDRALKETSPSHRIHRSTTGTTENSVFNKRTSENAFDTHGAVAVKVKRRTFEMLGFDDVDWAVKGHDDGLQVLRYNKTTAYTSHMDYMTDRSGQELFDYDSAGKGGNRFATVLLYMTDLGENGGGETVFPGAWNPETPKDQRQSLRQAIQSLRASGDGDAAGIKRDSWEEEMVATCRSKLAVKPYRGRAVLFYSEHPNGKPDQMSKHGGCPVLNGEKWAANLWVWNTPRGDFEGQPLREDLIKQGVKPPQNKAAPDVLATFRNTGKNPAMKEADLYYDEGLHWGKLGHGSPPLRANTFEGHRWNIRVDGKIVQNWVIGKDKNQDFEI